MPRRLVGSSELEGAGVATADTGDVLVSGPDDAPGVSGGGMDCAHVTASDRVASEVQWDRLGGQSGYDDQSGQRLVMTAADRGYSAESTD